MALQTRVSRRESFSAAHQLCDPSRLDEENRRVYGDDVQVHGHNYVVEVTLSGPVDPATGYLMDLKRLSDLIVSRIVEDVDHRNLNTDVPWLRDRMPTAENLALAFWERLRPHVPEGLLRTVRVYETEKNWAECCADG